MPDHELTLAEHASPTQHAGPGLQADLEAEIGRLVDLFYDRTRADPLLGPVFERHVADWDAHLGTMRDFWTSAVYRTGRYSGRPFEAHRPLSELTPEHFARWLELWEGAVRDVVRSPAAAPLLSLARRMALNISARMNIPVSLPDAG